MKTLEELSREYQCLKGSQWHNYMVMYDLLFTPIREKVMSILEIGIAEGTSLKIWQDYFPHAIIYGVDINVPKNVTGDRIRMFEGKQQDWDFLKQTMDKIGPCDVIIDDGGHILQHQLCSLLYLIDWVREGGFYIIEDVPETNLKFWEFLTMHMAGISQGKLEQIPIFTGPITESILGFRRKKGLLE